METSRRKQDFFNKAPFSDVMLPELERPKDGTDMMVQL